MASTTLAQLAHGRDNNFNLIRIIAAYAVLVSHSFALATGDGGEQPLLEVTGRTIGEISVDIFFIISGFLVTASLMKRQSVAEFVWARFLRVYPALFVVMLLTVLVLGPVFTTLPLQDYFTDPMTRGLFLRNITLFGGVDYFLPGVFAGLPYNAAVNGSLWTMPHEVRLYAVLALLWIGARLFHRRRFGLFRAGVIGAMSVWLIIMYLSRFGVLKPHTAHPLMFMFLCGASYQLLKDRVRLTAPLFLSMTTVLVLSTIDKGAFFVVYTLSLGYLVLYLAYIPGGLVRRYNRVGDYSYGVYIYAFPIQQSLAALIPGISVAGMTAGATVLTLAAAVLSWHLLEKRALGFKGHFVDFSRRLLSFARSRA